MKAKSYRIKWICIIAAIAAVCLAITVVLGIMFNTYKVYIVGTHVVDDGGSVNLASGDDLVIETQEEGTVMVKNVPYGSDQTKLSLPLDESVTKVNVFGWAATDWVISGSGSGQVRANASENKHIMLLDALTEAGIEYNTEITDMYERFCSARNYGTNNMGNGALGAFNYEYSRLYEPSIGDKSFYTEAMMSNAEEFSDTALVVLGRVSGESNDSPKVQYKFVRSTSGNPEVDETRTYLEISTEEEELLSKVGGKFDNVIVIINSVNVMELGFLDDIAGLDSCLVVAGTGSSGATAIPKILKGEVNPSGKLVDTYAYDFTTNPTYTNTGSGLGNAAGNTGMSGATPRSTNLYKNSDSTMYPLLNGVLYGNAGTKIKYDGVAYTDYQEGIYVGYKWYETADAMGFWNSDFAKTQWKINNGYEDVVQYPFGYGLSYTTFDWEVTPPTLSVTKDTIDDEITFSVKVTNTGNIAGKDVVELYVTPPYKNGGVEKSAVNLVAFGKTVAPVKAGESAGVEVSFKARDLASYDYENRSGLVPGGGYVLEAGDYKLSFRTDSHTPKARVSEYNIHIGEGIAITTDESGNTISNKFTGEDALDGLAVDGNSDGSVGEDEIVYMTRDDFEGTFPITLSEPRDMTAAVKKYSYWAINNNAWNAEWQAEHADAEDIITNANTGKKVYDASASDPSNRLLELGETLGTDFHSDEWTAVLDQMELSEMTTLSRSGYGHTAEVRSIGKPNVLDLDGPNQIGSFNSPIGATGFCSIIIAQTWNPLLAFSMGRQIGNDAAAIGVGGWYGPGVNIHRSPFGGRNFEYYSEDARMTGVMAANAIEGAKYAGVYSYLKHLVLYETESFRDGMYTWTTEQALREIYLKPFEIAIKHKDRYGLSDSGATGIMSSYGRVGGVWAGGSQALLSDEGVLRGEWDFKGAVLTDYADYHQFMNGDQMIRMGGDMWMSGASNSGSMTISTNADKQMVRRAAKNITYMWLNALAVNKAYNAGVKLYQDYIEENPDGTNPPEGAINDTAAATPSISELNFDWTILVLIIFIVLWVAGLTVWLIHVLKKSKKLAAKESGSAPTDVGGDNTQE